MSGDTQADLRRIVTCDGCHQQVDTVVKVTDHVGFCPTCLDKYGAVKL